jgi:hypothetical protein
VGDVTRALILPDLDPPSFEHVRNLAVFWDEVICLKYGDHRSLEGDDPLLIEGVVKVTERDLPPEAIFPTAEAFDGEQSWAYHFSRDPSGEIKVELAPSEEASKRAFPPLQDLSDEDLEGMAAIELGFHLGYIDDSLAIAAENNLAPISHSLGGHLATVVGSSQGPEDEPPSREAALLSVVVESFSIDPNVSSEEILSFRSRNAAGQARLRGSFVDLASTLRSDSSPTTMLAEARDVYRNRVEPALGDLEEALKESQIKFFLKSVVGATAIAIAPIEPVSSSVGAARIVGQSIDYSYSKSKLLREHPYGYLHEVQQNLVGANPTAEGIDNLALTLMSPRNSLWRLWLEWWKEARDFLGEAVD